jgi:tRNA threonylcarbamoyl adenosine modification protein YjeE
MTHFSFFLANDAATRAFGEELALTVRPGDCLALYGDLGAGKSALSRALIRAMANDDELEVPSPTFTLVQSYELRIPVSHFDLYRLGDESELNELGLDEALEKGVALIEWPDRAGSLLPKHAIRITITHEGAGRRLEIDSDVPRFNERLIRVRAMREFLDSRGYANASRRFLIGDSSFRAYERLRTGRRQAVRADGFAGALQRPADSRRQALFAARASRRERPAVHRRGQLSPQGQSVGARYLRGRHRPGHPADRGSRLRGRS